MTTYLNAVNALVVIILMVSCVNNDSKDDFGAWKEERLSELKGPYGWPSVVGLYPLNDSITTLGSESMGGIILPPVSPPILGTLHSFEDNVELIVEADITNPGHIQHDQSVNLYPTVEQEKLFDYANLRMFVIKRKDQLFLRVLDTLSEYRQKLRDIPRFTYADELKVSANFIPSDSTKKVVYQNILGMEFHEPFAGYLDFTLLGNPYRLIALGGGGEELFVLFNDMTTGQDTYSGGRYLYPKKAGKDGKVILDFNKAINPPCVFTPYATCPLPPVDNFIPLRIEAGEKYLELY